MKHALMPLDLSLSVVDNLKVKVRGSCMLKIMLEAHGKTRSMTQQVYVTENDNIKLFLSPDAQKSLSASP